MLVIDTATYERQLFNAGQRGTMQDPSGKPRARGSTLSLGNLLQSLGLDAQCTLHNAGNAAFVSLLALQTLLDPEHTKAPAMRGRAIQQNVLRNASRGPAGMGLSPALGAGAHMGMGVPGAPLTPPLVAMYGLQVPPPLLYAPPHSPAHSHSHSPSLDEFGARSPSAGYFAHQHHGGSTRSRKTSGLAPADGRGSVARRGSAGVEEAAERLGNMRVV